MTKTQYSVALSVQVIWQQPNSRAAPHGHQWTRPVELDNMFESNTDIQRMLQIAKTSMKFVMDVKTVSVDPNDPRNILIVGTRSKRCVNSESEYRQEVIDIFEHGADGYMEGDISMPVIFSPKHDAEILLTFVSLEKKISTRKKKS